MEEKEFSKEVSTMVCGNLKRLAKKQKVTEESIASKTGMKRQSVNRLFTGKFAPRLDLVVLILNAISTLSDPPQTFTLKDIDYETTASKNE